MKKGKKDIPQGISIEKYEKILRMAYHPLAINLHHALNISLPEEINQIFLKSCDLKNEMKEGTPYFIVKNRTEKNDVDFFYNLLHMGVQDGLCAVLYNLNTFIEISNFVRDKYSELARITEMEPGKSMALPTQKLVFEYEHFTLHERIVLDRLGYFLDYFFKTDTKNILRLYNSLENNQQDNVSKRLVSVIERHRPILERIISTEKGQTERDIIAHRKIIMFTGANVNLWPENKIYVKLFAPNQTEQNYFKQKEADEVLNERFQCLLMFIIQFLNAFLDFRQL